MNQTTKETRRRSYDAVLPKRAARCRLILETLGNRELTASEITEELVAAGRIPYFNRNYVAPRLTELKEIGILTTVGRRKATRSDATEAVWARAEPSGPTGQTAAAYAALLDLVTDICKRNGIKRLVWSTRKNDRVNHLNGCNMTVHRDYANKSCPGDYLYNRHGQIAAEVNKRLGVKDAGSSTGGQTSGNTETGLKVGDVVDFKGTQHYTSAAAKDAKICKPGKATITAIAAGKAHPYHLKTVSGGGSTVYGWVNAADISTGSTGTATSYRVRTTADVLNIRKGPGTNYGVAGQIKGKGIYTIVAEAAGPGATKWGKLKSGAGWISLDYVTKL